MPKRKRRGNGRSGSLRPGHAHVSRQLQLDKRYGGRQSKGFRRRGQRGSRQMPFSRSPMRGSAPDYDSRDVFDPSEGTATTAGKHLPERKFHDKMTKTYHQFRFQMTNNGFPSDEKNNFAADCHSNFDYDSRDVFGFSKGQHDRATKAPPKRKRYDNSVETDLHFGFKAVHQRFPFDERTKFVTGYHPTPECGGRDAFCSAERLLYRATNAPMEREQYVNSTEKNHNSGFQMAQHDFPFDERKYLATEQNKNISLPVVRNRNQTNQSMQKGTDSVDQNFLYCISSVLRCLVKNGNRMKLDQLKRKVESEHARKYPDFEMEIESFPNIFHIDESVPDTENDGNEEEGILRNKFVSGKTDVRLCEKHCSNAGSCSSEDCNGLHVCKFYILDTCSFSQCLFGHHIRDPHNFRVLQMHLLHALSPGDLGYLMRNIRNRNETTMPTVCRFYNGWKGCSHKECQFLHLCRWFVTGNCKYGLTCQRSHNYFDQQPSLVLKRYGILEEKYIDVVKKFLRNKYKESAPTNDTDSTMEIKSNYVVEKGKDYSAGSCRLNRYVEYYQNHPSESKGNPLRKSINISYDGRSKIDDSKVKEWVSAEILDPIIDLIFIREICKVKEEGAQDSILPRPNWTKPCLRVPSCDGKLEVKGLTQFSAASNETNVIGDQKLGKAHALDLEHECLDITDPSKHLERPHFSGCLSTPSANKLDSCNSDDSGTEFVQATSATGIENDYTVIPVNDELFGGSEQRLSVTIPQKHANSNGPEVTRSLELTRVIAKDGMPAWRCRFVDTMTSLTLESDTCDHLEKCYQRIQQLRTCSIEIYGSQLEVDLLTMKGAIS